MTRDFDLIRKLLVFFDEKAGPEHVAMPNVGDEDSDSKVMYHLLLMYQGGLLDCEPQKSSTSDRVISVIPFNLTWEGHEFLAKIRSEGTWQKVKDLALSKGGSLSFAVLNQVATKLALSVVSELL